MTSEPAPSPRGESPRAGSGRARTPRSDDGTRARRGRPRREGDQRRRRPDPERAAARAERIARRQALVPEGTYPEALPVSAERDRIMAAIRDHQVVVIAGETGSGKTTQLPKMCLELGRGVRGVIGHTQPRRLAARSVAERISEELKVELGTTVGYQVRFTDRSSQDTLVKVMTDGILLAEMQRDRDLRRYDTLIIDEAHERSLNIDFILGYLKQLLPRRPDLKVVITSATIDPERFARHFADTQGRPAPVIEVSGRTFPVEVRYRPLVRDVDGVEEPVDQVTGIVDAVTELWTEHRGDGGGEDILVFLSGEREIRDAADALHDLDLPGTEILPLFARLSAAEQHRVFSRHSGRRVVLATNVAETSLTVPGIRYVVDTGTARISRYSQRLKVQRLPIEPISQASARQRSGRCGRLADGIAIRLYSEEDYLSRPAFTDPEILRTNLASVILQMTTLGLGDIARFPFVERPDTRQITDGVRLLEELQAFEDAEGEAGRRRLSKVGRAVAALPVDPRLARMVVAAHEAGALREVMIIAAALSMQDVRERPQDKQAQADQAHARFKDERSDFTTILNLWNHLKHQQRELSNSAFRRMCQREFLHYLRVREWQDLVSQLREAAADLRMTPNSTPADADKVHDALLTGLLSHVGLWERERREYLGARGARFALQPGSVLHRKNPDWVMSAELVETTRLWARTNAATDPTRIERAAAHLVKRSHSEPHWERKRGSAVALEKVSLYGIPLANDRHVALGPVDPALARELFLRHALVEGDWDTRHAFFHDNRRLLRELGEIEERTRRRDLIVDDETLFEFYDARIPAEVVSGAHFDTWWKKASRANAQLLTFTPDFLLEDAIAEVSLADFPQTWTAGEHDLPLSYQFEPGADADGVTVHVPLAILNRIDETGFDWQVPGLRAELATAYVKALPKAHRKHFVPAPDRAAAALAQVEPFDGTFAEALARGLFIITGYRVEPAAFDLAAVPDHLRVTFRVEDSKGRTLGEGKSLLALQERLAARVRSSMAQAASAVEKRGLTAWTFGELPTQFAQKVGGRVLQGYPALVDHGDSVAVEVLATPAERDAATVAGLRRLVLLNVTVPWQRILGLMPAKAKLALADNPDGTVPALLDDVLAAAVDSVVAEQPHGTVRDKAQFDAAVAAVRQQLVPRVLELVDLLDPVLTTARAARLAAERLPASSGTRKAVLAHLDALLKPGFVAEIGYAQLHHAPRWLRGIAERVEKGSLDPARDAQRQDVVDRVRADYADLLVWVPATDRTRPDLRAIRWMLEELEVSLFAQRLGTAHPVSEQRVYKALDAIEAEYR